MPPSPPIANGRQLTVLYSHGGQPAVSVLGGYATEPSDPMTLAEGNRWLAAWWNAIKGSITNDVTCTGAILRDISVIGGTVVEIPAPASPTGAVTGATSLASGARVLKWGTAVGTRSGRGKTFVPGLPQSVVQAGGRNLTSVDASGFATGVKTAYLDVLAPTAGNVVPAVVSRKDGIARQITTVACATIVGIQRNRMRA